MRIGFLSKGDDHFFPSKEKGKDELQRKQHVQKARGSTAHLWRKQRGQEKEATGNVVREEKGGGTGRDRA